jgi:hypothetical protein
LVVTPKPDVCAYHLHGCYIHLKGVRCK